MTSVPLSRASFFLCFLIWGVRCVWCLRSVSVRVPWAVPRGETALLDCLFDLEGASLYSVKWYIGRSEFYRFTPRERPQIKVFPVQGLQDLVVQKDCCNASRVCLSRVGLSLSGRYSCEVTADSPSFSTALVSSHMEVVVAPRDGPLVWGVRARYREGDTLAASCESPLSRPAANLTWAINGRQVKAASLTVRGGVVDGLLTAVSDIRLRLTSEHSARGRLKVRCSASLYSLYWQITELSAELARPKSDRKIAEGVSLISPDPAPSVNTGLRIQTYCYTFFILVSPLLSNMLHR